jgi:predicted amidohydrolase
MTALRVALLQMAAQGSDQRANRAIAEAWCRRAAAEGADIALFPEMWNIGYTWFDDTEPGAHERWESGAVTADGEFVAHFRALARELHLAIAVTYLERWAGRPRNTLSLIDRHGETVLTYAKVHTCDFSHEAALTPGDAFHVVGLDTAAGMVRVGAMICFDREFPESARVLMLQGAELILVPNACELEQNRLAQFRARAYENMTAMAMTNYPAPQQNGHSVAMDGMAFRPHGGGSRDMMVAEAGEGEELLLATFDLDALRAYRRAETCGDAYRKPYAYDPLIAPGVSQPFVREDSRRSG